VQSSVDVVQDTASAIETSVGGVQTSVNAVQTSVTGVQGTANSISAAVATAQASITAGDQSILTDLGTVKTSVGTGDNTVLQRATSIQATVTQQLTGGSGTLRGDVSVIKSIVAVQNDEGIVPILRDVAYAVGALTPPPPEGEPPLPPVETAHEMLVDIKSHFHIGMEVPYPPDPQY
jgi:hypothetical protein